jgi:uncharacterized protein (TIGR00730 family)
MKYRMNDDDLDARIAGLVGDVADPQVSDRDREIVGEIIVTGLKLLRDQAGRADLKMMNTALKELRYSSIVFDPHRASRKIAVFGSARTRPEDPNYLLAEEFSKRMATDEGWMVITGAGPGIMEAANRGAGLEGSLGVNIRLPFENGANEYLSPGKVINFKYFFTRKVQFVKESDAFALFPGGWGTMDEAFELLTLIQTGKSDMHPIVLLEAPGTRFWEPWERLCDNLLEQGMISEHDKNLYTVAPSIDAAIEEVTRFFRVYHSQRFVDDLLVLRLNDEVSDATIGALNAEFSDIVTTGEIFRTAPFDAEVSTNDNLDLPRLAFAFDRRSFGRLRVLIDRINEA